MAANTNSEAEPKTRRLPGGRLGLVLLVLVLSIGGGVLGLVLAVGPSGVTALLSGEPPAQEEMAEDVAESEAGNHGGDDGGHDTGHGATGAKEMAVTPFREIIVNIQATTATGRTTSRFMKLNVALVYDEAQEGSGRIEERRLFLRDSFQDYLRQLTERDLQGSIGLLTIKQELLRRARTITESDAPQEMLVSDLIVQ